MARPPRRKGNDEVLAKRGVRDRVRCESSQSEGAPLGPMLVPRAPMRVAQVAPDLVIVSFGRERRVDPTALEALTQVQREVVEMALAGLSDAEIAAARRCSRYTVSSHLQSAYRRLGVCSRSELAALVVE